MSPSSGTIARPMKLWHVTIYTPPGYRERKIRAWRYVVMAPTAEVAVAKAADYNDRQWNERCGHLCYEWGVDSQPVISQGVYFTDEMHKDAVLHTKEPA